MLPICASLQVERQKLTLFTHSHLLTATYGPLLLTHSHHLLPTVHQFSLTFAQCQSQFVTSHSLSAIRFTDLLALRRFISTTVVGYHLDMHPAKEVPVILTFYCVKVRVLLSNLSPTKSSNP